VSRGSAGVEGNEICKRLTEQHGAQYCGNHTETLLAGRIQHNNKGPGLGQYGFEQLEASSGIRPVMLYVEGDKLTMSLFDKMWMNIAFISADQSRRGLRNTNVQE
jgi:hypothetical protein